MDTMNQNCNMIDYIDSMMYNNTNALYYLFNLISNIVKKYFQHLLNYNH